MPQVCQQRNFVMPEMLLINPRKRRAAGAKRRKAPSAKQRANWARFAKAAKARANPAKRRAYGRKRRANPASAVVRRAVRRVTRRTHARRRNPISLGGSGLFNLRSYLTPIKDAAVMGAGAVAVDVGFGYINRYLPMSMQVNPAAIGAGDAVKAVLTVALGKLLSKPTRGLSQKAAMGSLVVQMRDITMKVLPASMLPVAGLGFVTAGRVVPQISSRANANMTARGSVGAGGAVGAYTGGTPLLSGRGQVGLYQQGLNTPLLSRAPVQRR
jgi:hypothetical protein